MPSRAPAHSSLAHSRTAWQCQMQLRSLLWLLLVGDMEQQLRYQKPCLTQAVRLVVLQMGSRLPGRDRTCKVPRERIQLGVQLPGRRSLRCPPLQSCSSLKGRPLVILMGCRLWTVPAVIRGLVCLQQVAASREMQPLQGATPGWAPG